MYKSYLFLFCSFLFLAHQGFGQHEVLVTFNSPTVLEKTLERAKTQSDRKSGSVFKVYRLRSKNAQHIALITSSITSDEWEKFDGVAKTLRSNKNLSARRTPNDPYFSEQWNFNKIDAEGAWEYTTGGSTARGDEIVIGVIEVNGFDLNHPELRNSYWRNPGEIPNNGIDDDNNGLIDDVNGWNFTDNTNTFSSDFHGVHVSAIIRASTDNGQQAAGLVWGGSIIPYQIDSFNKWILALDQLTTLREQWNDSQGVQGVFVPVVNMSFGSEGSPCDDSPELQDALIRAGEAGILCVGATSNGGGEITPNSPDVPSTCPQDNLIVVTASTMDDEIRLDSRFSSIHVDLSAPGDAFRSVDYNGQASNFFDTSGATPHVTGTVALMYSSDCENLITLAYQQPALAATLVKEALLNGVDKVDGFSGLVSTDGRLNARKAIERLLDDVCGNNALIIQLAPDSSADTTLILSSGESLDFSRTLSQEWNIHLYSTNSSDITEILSDAIATPSIIAAEPDIRFLLRSRTPTESGFQIQAAVKSLSLPLGWGVVYGDQGSPLPVTDVVTAVFDQNFDVMDRNLAGRFTQNLEEIPDNGLDDDNNGFIDDVVGANLSSRAQPFTLGRHGKAMSNILAANVDDGLGIAGVDWAGKILPLQGNSMSQWIEGANYIANLRRTYNATNANAGRLVVSYLTPQGGARNLLPNQTSGVAEEVIANLYALGILTVGAMPNEIVDISTDFPGGIRHEGIIRATGNTDASNRLSSLSDQELDQISFAPDENVVFDVSVLDTSLISGTSASAALTAGGISLLYQVNCNASGIAPLEAPNATAERIRNLLFEEQLNPLDLTARATNIGFAVQKAALPCIQVNNCNVVTPIQNPITRGATVTINIASPENQTCPVKVVDALGRIVFEATELQNDLLNQISLSTQHWSSGIYYISLGENEVTSKPILVLK